MLISLSVFCVDSVREMWLTQAIPSHLLFFLSFAATICRCSLFPVQWLSSFFYVLFFLGAHHTDNCSEAKKKKKSRLSHLFQLDLCTGAAGALGAECCGTKSAKLIQQRIRFLTPFTRRSAESSSNSLCWPVKYRICRCLVDNCIVLICCLPHQYLDRGEIYCCHEYSQ